MKMVHVFTPDNDPKTVRDLERAMAGKDIEETVETFSPTTEALIEKLSKERDGNEVCKYQ